MDEDTGDLVCGPAGVSRPDECGGGGGHTGGVRGCLHLPRTSRCYWCSGAGLCCRRLPGPCRARRRRTTWGHRDSRHGSDGVVEVVILRFVSHGGEDECVFAGSRPVVEAATPAASWTLWVSRMPPGSGPLTDGLSRGPGSAGARGRPGPLRRPARPQSSSTSRSLVAGRVGGRPLAAGPALVEDRVHGLPHGVCALLAAGR